jgi:hypothetical protein
MRPVKCVHCIHLATKSPLLLPFHTVQYPLAVEVCLNSSKTTTHGCLDCLILYEPGQILV